MVIVHVKYAVKPGMGRQFVQEIETSGVAAAIRAEDGCIMYDYFYPATGADEVLLVERWRDMAALDVHQKQPHMASLANIKGKYAINVTIEKYAVQ